LAFAYDELIGSFDMRQAVLHYFIVFGIFLAIDAVWLTNAGRLFYVPEIGALLRERPNFLVAFFFYAVFALGLLVFVVQPQLASGTIWKTLVLGGFFGFVAYATYDLTNLATLKGFTTRIALIDMAWGAVLSASVSAAAVWLIRLLKL
jgi:uncharacterized membrane protein